MSKACEEFLRFKGLEYIGELVLSEETIYLVTQAGRVREVGNRHSILGQ